MPFARRMTASASAAKTTSTVSSEAILPPSVAAATRVKT
jgi:hypothetical protein